MKTAIDSQQLFGDISLLYRPDCAVTHAHANIQISARPATLTPLCLVFSVPGHPALGRTFISDIRLRFLPRFPAQASAQISGSGFCPVLRLRLPPSSPAQASAQISGSGFCSDLRLRLLLRFPLCYQNYISSFSDKQAFRRTNLRFLCDSITARMNVPTR